MTAFITLLLTYMVEIFQKPVLAFLIVGEKNHS